MKLGLVSAILDWCSYEEMIDIVSKEGLECVEVACWPKGKSTRRYAGVSHIDIDKVLTSDTYAKHIISYAKSKKVDISSLAYYENVLDGDTTKRNNNIKHLMKVIKASHKLGVNMVTTFIGRDQYKTVDENLVLAKKVWTLIMKEAQKNKVKIGIENCPMLFGKDQWPGGQNIMNTPTNWDKVFNLIKSDNLGLNFDPSHFVWQMMDYIQVLYDYKDKMFHIHIKDIKLFKNKLNKVGTMAYPLDFMSPKLPGLGDVNWSNFISALTSIGYNGYVCLEIEDKAFEKSHEDVLKSIRLSKNYIKQFPMT